ncbi:putative ribosome production factor 2 [Monocercomonoides exilis]|uniref:putative ribosome production factor 2 n=1 Tax=Monocercomonoides exilis TaxID=2049356 RepID=UPI00355A093E|nr:putative ribosome production factor 2 [Monocercomonoides exilis]|eukprot:MONOS_8224.1-p1 / transcript=MONOS_8224.1 / gene=MONOS_8224 / organism=Monocercomonoides_exilis_PA203 / gene_product=putative Brix domain containing protein 1 variant 1 / transcript_product=putative Brix domain containing protein 1 variant 1 / location=Mono_scaffold00304:30779-32586(+) / protein_length=464 / sequence_SO=supercontig / SO=protein_coding / is_pseudo=false
MEKEFQDLYKQIKRTKDPRSRRKLQERMPVLEEKLKTPLIISGGKTNPAVKEFLKDIAVLKRPYCISYSRNHDISPFEQDGMEQLQLFAKKVDSSLFLFGQSLKKRPMSVIFGRMFSYQVTEMVELSILSYSPMMEFADKVKTPVQPGGRPYMQFCGDLFESNPVFSAAQSILLDFFRGPVTPEICLSTSNVVMSFFAVPGVKDGSPQKLVLRTYAMESTATMANDMEAQKVPNISLTEIGPSAIFTIQRTYRGSNELIKASFAQVKTHKTLRKNIKKGIIPGLIEGRVHIQKQDLKKLEDKVKKNKALRKANEIAKKAQKELSEGANEEAGKEEDDSQNEEDEELDDASDSFDDEDDEDEDGNDEDIAPAKRQLKAVKELSLRKHDKDEGENDGDEESDDEDYDDNDNEAEDDSEEDYGEGDEESETDNFDIEDMAKVVGSDDEESEGDEKEDKAGSSEKKEE